MKPPGWMVLQEPKRGRLSEDGRSVVFTYRLRLWHPGLWLVLALSLLCRLGLHKYGLLGEACLRCGAPKR